MNIIAFLLIVSLLLLNTNLITDNNQPENMKRVTGIGGIFFKSSDPRAMQEWYKKHLGFVVNEDNSILFEWKDVDQPAQSGYTVWAPFKETTKYFEPSQKQFMINFRVNNLKDLLEQLKKEGVQVVGEMQEEPYGKFGWIMDPDGNKIELWEPVDNEFTKLYKGKTNH
jgi:predicted enzyme related to lactoylglutathione lyase